MVRRAWRDSALRVHHPEPPRRWWRRKSFRIAYAIIGTSITGALTASLTGAITDTTTEVGKRIAGFNTGTPSTSATSTDASDSPTTGPEPFAYSLRFREVDEDPCHAYAINRAPSQIRDPGEIRSQVEQPHAWARRLGGIDVANSYLRLTIQGTTESAVTLQGIRVRIVKRSSIGNAMLYTLGWGCGAGPAVPRKFSIDLDRTSPSLHPEEGSDDSGAPIRAPSFPLVINSENPEIIDIDGNISRSECSWELLLDWTSGNKSGVTVINDGGSPFKTTAPNRKVNIYYSGRGSGWVNGGKYSW